MRDYSQQNKIAWEYDAYAFWVHQYGDECYDYEKILKECIIQCKIRR